MAPRQEIELDDAVEGELVDALRGIVRADETLTALTEATGPMPLIEMEVDGKDVILHDDEWSGFHSRPIPLGYPESDTPIYDKLVGEITVGPKPDTDLYQK